MLCKVCVFTVTALNMSVAEHDDCTAGTIYLKHKLHVTPLSCHISELLQDRCDRCKQIKFETLVLPGQLPPALAALGPPGAVHDEGRGDITAPARP